MKNFLLFLLMGISSVTWAQAPAQINYQGIARNAVGNVLPLKNISLRLSIHDGSSAGTVVYRETRNVTTSNLGMFHIAIGGPGAVTVTGTLAGVDWSAGTKFLQVEMDPEGGSNFTDMGTGQLLSVPYALYAGSGAPSGNAGGELSGSYPNPSIAPGVITTSKLADNSVTTAKIMDASVTAAKLAPGVIPASLPPIGTAGGDLTGAYPNPAVNAGAITSTKLADNAVATNKIIDNAVTTPKIADASVTAIKLAPGVIPASLPPGGAAGGDLTGSYPNPVVNTGAITSTKLADNAVATTKIIDNAVTTPKLADASVTAIKLAPGVIPTSIPPGGAAGGDLTGTYPNPTVSDGVITSTKLADNAVASNKILDNAVTTTKIADASVTAIKLAPGVIPTSIPPGGAAGGDLTGTYPNPTVSDGVITSSKLSDNAVTSNKILDNAIITTKIADASVTAIKLAPGVIPTSLPPAGAAGGDLTGSYPNPVVNAGAISSTKLADNAVTTAKLVDASVTAIKLAPGVIPTSLPPAGAAGGDLAGSYPNPVVNAGAISSTKLADNAVTTAKLLDASVTAIKLAPGVIPNSLPPAGAAGGDLVGAYPNPTLGFAVVDSNNLAINAVTSKNILDNAITTSKVMDASITMAKLGPDVIFGSGGAPSGPAGGDLSGTYPNPNLGAGSVTLSKIANGAVITPKIADAAVTTNKISDNAITTAKVADGSITMAKLGPDVVLGGGTPTGAAGGDLSGTYPNPTINTLSVSTTKIADAAVTNPKLADNAVGTSKLVDGSVTAIKLAAGVVPTTLPPNGLAGGDLTGTYPNPAINTSAISTIKIADAAVTETKLATNAVTTSKILDATVTAAKLAPGVLPTTLPPSGTAGGDLAGNYPNPSIGKLQGVALSNTAPAAGQVLKYNGTQWTPAIDNAGGLVLPYAFTDNNLATLFSLTNLGAGSAIEGHSSSNTSNATGLLGTISAAGTGANSSGVKGLHNSSGDNGMGVWGTHLGTGPGVYGSAASGTGVFGRSLNGNGIFASSYNNAAGYFDMPNFSGTADAITAYNVGAGNGITSISEGGNGLWAITYNGLSAAVLGYNIGGGEGIVGRNASNGAAAVIGRNDGTFGGVQGIGAADSAIGVLAVANADGFVGGNALVASVEGAGGGNPAVFKANGSNVARIDHTGKAFFNGGTQVGGADVAEYFAVTGNRNSYEPGDILVISQHADRTVERSAGPYSTLVAGVYATKPGLMLTEENAEQDQLDHMVPMGVIGVIPTKICLEGGPVKRGDLLVTSSLPGVAMKADPDKIKPGQLIGKALQQYDQQGTGIINVLVSVK